MKDSLEERLKYLVDRFGGGIFQDHLSRDNHRRGEALIRDVFGDQHRREAFVLVMAMKERVVADLLAGGKDVPIEVVCARLVARLEKNLGLTEELARWGVATWAVALGFARPEFQSDDAVAASDLEPATTYISKEMRDDELPHKTAKSPLTEADFKEDAVIYGGVICLLALVIFIAWGIVTAVPLIIDSAFSRFKGL